MRPSSSSPLRSVSENGARFRPCNKKVRAKGFRTTQSFPSLSVLGSLEQERTEIKRPSSMIKRHKSTIFHIDGPFTPQSMEIYSSSSGSDVMSSTPPRKPRLGSGRRMMTSSPPSPSPVRGTPRSRSRCLVPSPSLDDEEEQFTDWQEYSRPIEELGRIKYPDREDSWSGDSRSSGGSEGDVLIPASAQSPGRRVNAVDLSALVVPNAPVTRPRKPEKTKVSKSPELPPITSGETTPPSSPFARTPGTNMSAAEFRLALSSVDFDDDDFMLPGSLSESVVVNIPREKFVSINMAKEDTRLVDQEEEKNICDGCGRSGWERYKKIIPCGICFSASIAAVAVTHGRSRCAACMTEVESFVPWRFAGRQQIDRKRNLMIESSGNDRAPLISLNTTKEDDMITISEDVPVRKMPQTEVLRIDNVAWDITPEVVKAYLPPNTLPKDHPQPIHILLDRHDGRTKDFMFVEVASRYAAQRVLFARQNSLMPGGKITNGRLRPVTISRATHEQLSNELRPKSKIELLDLLQLCQAAVECRPLVNPNLNHTTSFVSSNGVAHFVKSRHGPFNALMSILSKLSGPTSPAYWDLFHVTSGAIAALATSIEDSSRPCDPKLPKYMHPTTDPEDSIVLAKLQRMHLTHFGKILGLGNSVLKAETCEGDSGSW